VANYFTNAGREDNFHNKYSQNTSNLACMSLILPSLYKFRVSIFFLHYSWGQRR
jgi:hypothetical protein